MRLVSLVSGFSSLERLDEVETFFAANPTPAAERTIEQEKERIEKGIPLHPEVLDWFKQICAEFSIEYRLG